VQAVRRKEGRQAAFGGALGISGEGGREWDTQPGLYFRIKVYFVNQRSRRQAEAGSDKKNPVYGYYGGSPTKFKREDFSAGVRTFRFFFVSDT